MTYFDFYHSLPLERFATILVKNVEVNGVFMKGSLDGRVFNTINEAKDANIKFLQTEMPRSFEN